MFMSQQNCPGMIQGQLKEIPPTLWLFFFCLKEIVNSIVENSGNSEKYKGQNKDHPKCISHFPHISLYTYLKFEIIFNG